MSRIACLVVPRFAIAALRRAEPELRGCPVVVCEVGAGVAAGAETRAGAVGGVRPHSRIVEVSPEAARRGVTSGLTLAQGLVRSADLVARPLDREALAAAREALVDVGRSVSPRVEAEIAPEGHRGAIYVEIDASERLFGSPSGIMAALLERAGRIGLEAGVAVADAKATARIAAGLAARRGEALLVPSGGDAAWLAPLPLGSLAPVAERVCAELAGGRRRASSRGWGDFAAELHRLGVASVGDLAALPVGEVVVRFGAAGARLWRIAAGQDDACLCPVTESLDVAEGLSLEFGVDSIEALLFVVRGLVDRVATRLRLRGLACRSLALSFVLEDGARVDRDVRVLAPTTDVKTLLLLARSTIEAAPPHAAIVGVRLVAAPDVARPDQLDFFRSAGPAPARLATALARLAALCGQGRVGSPVLAPGHRPEAFAMKPFSATAGGSPVSSSVKAGEARHSDPLTAGKSQHSDPLTAGKSPLSGSATGASWSAESPSASTWGHAGNGLALRAIRPPKPAEVFLERGEITYVRAPGLGGRALLAAGPWRLDAEWWSDAPCRRDYFEVQLSDGGVYRLYREAAGWWVDGRYD